MDKSGEIMIIGVAGGTGSGKTTLAENIASSFGDKVAVITHDSYYCAQNDKTYEERCKQNYDHPDAFETDLLCEHLDALARGEAVDIPVYDYTVHNRSDKTQKVEPRAVIVLEGTLIFSDKRLRDRMSLKIFVDTDADERILRRARRDMEVRGRKIDDIMEQYLTTVKPMHETHVEPSKKHADLILNGGLNPVALEIVAGRVKDFLNTL